MTKITFVEANGKKHEFDVNHGDNCKDIAVKNNLEGLPCECGGALACATCHVYVDKAWKDKLAPPSNMEQDMLDFAPDLQANSRLCCQINMNDDLDGLVLHIPENSE